MTPEITDIDAKVTRIEFRPTPRALAAVSSEIVFLDELLMVTRLTYRSGDEVWHEHLMHELLPCDDPPEAS